MKISLRDGVEVLPVGDGLFFIPECRLAWQDEWSHNSLLGYQLIIEPCAFQLCFAHQHAAKSTEFQMHQFLLHEAGFEDIQLVEITGYKTSPTTVGATFKAHKAQS